MAQTISALVLRIRRPWVFAFAAYLRLPTSICGWLGGVTCTTE